MSIRWFDEIGSGDVDLVGGKAASLGELTEAELPVPPGFVVTADVYRAFMESTGILEDLQLAVDVDPEDPEGLRAASNRAQELITGVELPERVRTDLIEAYDRLDATDEEPTFVAIRSSATAEDLPDASFAGQQDTYLNVTKSDLIDRVRDCWASLFTQRAIYYRNQQGFPVTDVAIAVVVQRMVDAEKSGVMFTTHPSTGEEQVIIEAAWGLGEAVVSGTVSPDNYTIDPASGQVVGRTIATKQSKLIRDPETGENRTVEVSPSKRDSQVLKTAEMDRLLELGLKSADHYGCPQDIEWAIAEGTVYVLQSRPITTIEGDGDEEQPAEWEPSTATNQVIPASDEDEAGVLVSGLGASPGTNTGPARIVTKLDHLDQVTDGDILVTEMTTPDMVPAMQRAVGLVTDEGGMTSHAAIVARELGIPAVVGTGSGTDDLEDGERITIDGEKGIVEEADEPAADRQPAAESWENTAVGRAGEPPDGSVGRVKPMTATEVKVNVSIPSAAERAAATGADGVGLLRIEHMILSLGKTPERYIAVAGERAYQDQLLSGIRTVADAFYPRPVRVRTLDAPTDEFRDMAGGEDEPDEHNPMLGFRGLRRSLAKPSVFTQELATVRRLYELGYDNIEVMFPLVTDASDVERARSVMVDAGIDPEVRDWGVMIETPASALLINEIADRGIDFVSFGTNDLTQYTLAVDRNNAAVADRFDELHPAVLKLLTDTIKTCRERGIDTSICGEAASNPRMVDYLIQAGISSLSPNIDAVQDVQDRAMRVEQRLLLESVR